MPYTLGYDALLVAGGSRYSYFGHEDWQPLAPELKSLESALDIRSRILPAFEAAEWDGDAERRRAWLTFVVVGAGPTGVEIAGQIAEIARDSHAEFPRHDTATARMLLVEAADRVLDRLPALAFREGRARAAADRRHATARAHGHRDRRRTRSTTRAPTARRLASRRGTVVWAAGVAPSPPGARARRRGRFERDRAGRLIVEEDLSLPEPSGGVRARRHGRRAARERRRDAARARARRDAAGPSRRARRLARLAGRQSPPFHYRDKGNLATIGRARAVADLMRSVSAARSHGSRGWRCISTT